MSTLTKVVCKLTDLVIITNRNVTPGNGGNNGPHEANVSQSTKPL